MPALVTNKFRIHNAKQFVEAFDEVSTTSGAAVSDASGLLNTNMYLFIGKTTAWSDDSAPPSPTDAVANTHYEHWRDMIAAKRITSADVSHVIPRKNGLIIPVTLTLTMGNPQNFYVMTDEFNVYKSPTMIQLQVVSWNYIYCKTNWNRTSIITDGYKWKFVSDFSLMIPL